MTTDFGLVAILLLVGVALRAKVKVLQQYFIPASLIAGFLGLLLGPSVLGWLPFSQSIADYPAILIAVIFGAIPIGAARTPWRKTFQKVRNMWLYSMLLTALCWGVGVVFAFVVLDRFWETPDGFGLMLGAGFLGGHGTAATVGEAFASMGWSEARDIGYTSATVGLLSAMIGGLLITKRFAKRNQTNFVTDFKDLPQSVRTGVPDEAERTAIGTATVAPNNIDPLLFHLALLGVVVGVSYSVSDWLQQLFPSLGIPLLSLAFFTGLLFQAVLRRTNTVRYVDREAINRIGGTATDLTVVFGIASINLSVVGTYVVPLILLMVVGIVTPYLILRFIAPRVFHQHWFENALFGWGWSTGSVAMGVALLKVADPKSEASTLEDYGMAYVGMLPFEILVITLGPILAMAGWAAAYGFGLFAIAGILLAVASTAGWLARRERLVAVS